MAAVDQVLLGGSAVDLVAPRGADRVSGGHQELTVELVEWLAPVSLGVVGGPVPSSVSSGGGPVPVWTLVFAALVGVGLLRRGMRAQA